MSYQVANIVNTFIIEFIKPHTNMLSFLFSCVRQLQNADVSA